MSLWLAATVFLPCIASVVFASNWLAEALDEVGHRFRLSPGTLGLITALGADSPEISSALAASVSGHQAVGIGVVFGSNLFNLAALLGLGALLSGGIAFERASVTTGGTASLLATACTALLAYHVIGAWWTLALLLLIVTLYALALIVRGSAIRSLPLPGRVRDALASALERIHQHAGPRPGDQATGKKPTAHTGWELAGIISGSVLLIVLGSVANVHAVLRMTDAFGIPKEVTGALVIAALTGIPNVYTSARLARHQRGEAMLSETLNSNTINIVVGIGVPAVVFGITSGWVADLELWWLIGLTCISLVLALVRGGLHRPGGITIIALYVTFVVVRIAIA
ncbi:MAG: sodium:calcium antiporter [Acidobacteriota bacterium]